MKPESQSYLQSWTVYLVARDGFRRLLVRLGCGTVTVGMPVAVSNRRGNADRLARVREISRHRLGDIPDRAALHDRRLRLRQHQLFVNGPDLGLFLVSFLAASAVFFRRGHRNVVLKVAHARSVFGVNLQGMLKALQVDALALGVDLVLSVVLIPLGHVRVLMQVLDDLPPTHADLSPSEPNLP